MTLGEVVLPTLNEAAALPWVLSRVPQGWRAIVVDNGSTDGSAEVAAALGALVVHEPRRGFGAAVHAGVTAAGAELVAICDADASLDPADLPRLAEPVLTGTADLVLGRRRPVGRGAWPAHARLANRLLASRIRATTGVQVHDLGPMRVARRAPLVALALTDRRSGYPLEMLLAASDAGWRVAELDVEYRPRVGRSKVTGTIRGTVTAIRDMQRLLSAHSAPTHPAHPSDPRPDPNPAA
ncbi:MAG TPA: glycosyltransferase family 2 protein [Amnibacterium sp.]|jgi:glycosyltransferase involved in cell wall biosynthesis|uniref:glycosyltransferase family 2 protein n=1 Tax=Amnibacterium sp. TaxID=1872496 RepID=UPI002F94B17E